jgi:integrase
MAFGTWPETGLAEACAERDAAGKVLAHGDDPAERIKLDRIAATVAASNSFKAVADDWLLKVEKEGRSAVTMKKLRWLLDFINASIGKRPIASISAHELLKMLRKMESKGRYETAKRLRSTCSQVFRYPSRQHAPSAMLPPICMAPSSCRSPSIEPQSPRPSRLESFYGPSKALRGIRTRAPRLSFCRMSSYVREICALQNGRTSPSPRRLGRSRHKTKMRRAHAIPLSRQTLKILASIVRRMQHWSDHLDFLRDGAMVLKGKFDKAISR